jgi:hypothetical protein
MSAPWLTMDGSIFRIRPVTRAGWIVVVAAFVADIALVITALVASRMADDPKWAFLALVGFPLVLLVLALIIAAKTPRGHR